jgi:hypothetical protein
MIKASLVHSAVLAAAGLLSATSVWAVDLPARKLGLWETASTSSLYPARTARTQTCFGADTERDLIALGETSMKQRACKTSGLQRSGDAYVYESSCAIGGHTMTTRTVMTYQGDTSNRSVTTMDSGDGKPPHTNTSDSHWLGDCKPGQKPGDRELMNQQEVMQRPAGRGHAPPGQTR